MNFNESIISNDSDMVLLQTSMLLLPSYFYVWCELEELMKEIWLVQLRNTNEFNKIDYLSRFLVF